MRSKEQIQELLGHAGRGHELVLRETGLHCATCEQNEEPFLVRAATKALAAAAQNLVDEFATVDVNARLTERQIAALHELARVVDAVNVERP